MKPRIHEIRFFSAGALPRTPLAEASIPNNQGVIPIPRSLPLLVPFHFLPCLPLLVWVLTGEDLRDVPGGHGYSRSAREPQPVGDRCGRTRRNVDIVESRRNGPQLSMRHDDDDYGSQPYGCFSRYRATSTQLPRANTVLAVYTLLTQRLAKEERVG